MRVTLTVVDVATGGTVKVVEDGVDECRQDSLDGAREAIVGG